MEDNFLNKDASMIQRLSYFIDSLCISVRKFELQIGASNGLIRKAIAKNTDIQSKWIAAIRENYPHLNLDWLLTGKGDMLKKNEKKSKIFSEKNVPPKCPPKMSPQNGNLSPQNVTPEQYDPADGIIHDFAANQATDQEQIDTLNELVAGLQRACDQKNLLLAAKDELLAAKDQTIAIQNNALKLLEGQINATTALIEELTTFLGNDAKKRPERANAPIVSDADAP